MCLSSGQPTAYQVSWSPVEKPMHTFDLGTAPNTDFAEFATAMQLEDGPMESAAPAHVGAVWDGMPEGSPDLCR